MYTSPDKVISIVKPLVDFPVFINRHKYCYSAISQVLILSEYPMKYVFLIGFFCISAQLSAQQSFVVTGDDAKTGFGSVSFSIGQVIVHSDSTNKGSVMHGLQLPYELFRNTVGIDELHEIQAEAYPNPTFDRVKITLPEEHQGTCSVSLVSLEGSILESHAIDGNEYLLSLSQYSPGMYSIVITKDARTVSSFSIIKH